MNEKTQECGCDDSTNAEKQDARSRQFIWEVKQAGGSAPPTIDFSTFLVSLGTSALYHLGASDLPDGSHGSVNLELAHETIDILTVLQEKTRGNLTRTESDLMCNLLYDLRLRYVQTMRKVKEQARA